MISLLFFILASICNAVQDTLSHHHSTSMFKKYTKGFWADANLESWKNKYIDGDVNKGMRKIFFELLDYPAFLTDSWHLFKSLSITFICLSIATFSLHEYYYFADWINITITVIIYGTLWNVTFSLFYNRILRRK